MKITSTERARLWRLKNPDRSKAIQQSYIERHPEKRKESFNNYWKRKRAEDPDQWKLEKRNSAKEYRKAHLSQYQSKEKEKSRMRRINNLKEVMEYNKKYNRTKRLQMYGLTEETYQQMVLKQSGKCALCNHPYEKFHIDHCHKSNRVRGLLCGGCNMMLGLIEKRLESKVDFIEGITKYLKH